MPTGKNSGKVQVNVDVDADIYRRFKKSVEFNGGVVQTTVESLMLSYLLNEQNLKKSMIQIKDVAEQMNLTKMNNHMGRSFILGCTFWQTQFKNVYITDYDIENDEDLRPKDQLMVFNGEGKYLIISRSLLTDTRALLAELRVFWVRNK